MVSHDLTAIRKTAHRMIFLEESIRFDGPTSNFPDLEKLADLRGINDPHEDQKCMWKISSVRIWELAYLSLNWSLH